MQGLGDALGQQRQQHKVPRTRRRAQVYGVFETQQALFDKRVQPLVHHAVQILQRPTDKQLRLQVRVERVGVAQDLFAGHARTALEEARQQRWQGEDVQHIVAVVGHQDGILLIQINDFAQGVALFGQQVHVLDVLDQRQAIAIRQSGMGRVGHTTQQRQVQVQLAGHGLFIQRQASGGQ